MQTEILLAVTVTSFIWLMAVFFMYQRHKNEQKNETADFNLRLESVLNRKATEMKESYDKGYADAESRQNLSVVVTPWREEIDSSSFWKNRKSLKLGYKHQVFISGIPCFEPHITVYEEITADKINQDNINKAFTTLDTVLAKIPNAGNSAVTVIGSAKNLATSLLNDVKLNKKEQTGTPA